MAITLIPAYGREYKSAKAVKADWESGKDFLICDFFHKYTGKPCNKQDTIGETLNIRYAGQTKVVVIKNKGA